MRYDDDDDTDLDDDDDIDLDDEDDIDLEDDEQIEETPRRADVIVPVYRDRETTFRCLESVLKRSGETLGSLIVVDDASPEPGLAAELDRLAEKDPRIKLIHLPKNGGFVHACNRGLRERSGDAVLLNSDTVVTEGWLAELAAVAHADDRTACVSPLSNNATICSVPKFCAANEPFAIAAELVLEATSDLPRSTKIPTGVGFCLYMRGEAIDLVGELDPIFGKGYNEENDWCMRAQLMGFVARRANHAYVHHLGGVSFQDQKNALDDRNARILNERYPHYLSQVRNFCDGLEGPLAARAVAAFVSPTIKVALDLRHLSPDPVGTCGYATMLARELARHPKIDLALIVHRAEQARGIPARIVLARNFQDEFDIIHKPAQVFDERDLDLLFRSSSHIVITYLDMIATRAKGVLQGPKAAERYLATSRLALQAASKTITISDHAREEIHREFHIQECKITVTYLGVDHERYARSAAENASSSAGNVATERSKRYWLSVATDFPHKNLDNLLKAYAIARGLWTEGDPPELVLAGGRTSIRNGVYARFAAGFAPEGVRFLGQVTDDELTRLYQNAEAFVFPSVYEGFGLPILEAMAAGTPVIAYPISSIPEVGGDAVLYPKSFTPADLAAAMIELAQNVSLRQSLIESGLEQSSQFTWSRTARETYEAYLQAIYESNEEAYAARNQTAEAILAWSRGDSTPFSNRVRRLRRLLGRIRRSLRQKGLSVIAARLFSIFH